MNQPSSSVYKCERKSCHSISISYFKEDRVQGYKWCPCGGLALKLTAAK